MALVVRALHVLFGGASPPPRIAQRSVSTLLVDPVTDQEMARFPGTRLGLADLSFAVAGGDCLAVLGVSGSGKSSLLRTLAGLQPSIRGDVAVNGEDVSALPPERRGIVYLHQEPVLFPHLSVLDNVAFPMTVCGVARRAAQRRAFDWMQRLYISELAGFSPQSVSGGQRHRVALARALCADPAVLLLDEPLAALDPAVRADIREALQLARAASGAAMVLVTHDLDDALAIATHIAAITRFSLTAAATPDALLNTPPDLETARLLGVYAEIPGAVIDAAGGPAFHWIGGSIPAPGAAPGSAVACVRSHEVVLTHGRVDDGPVLLVVERKERAHEVLLTVQRAHDLRAVVRVGNGVTVSVGDEVQVTITNARIFSAR